MKKKIILVSVAILLVISLIVGVSYAYWRLSYTQTGVNKLASSCFSMELNNEKNNITLDSAYPISDEKGRSLVPYSFTITNTCDLFASYTINLEMLEGTTLSSKYIKSMINNEEIINLNNLETTETSIDGAVESRILFRGSLGSGDSNDYTLRVWMDSATPATDDTMNKVFQGKITVTAEVSTYSPVENGFTNLADALLVNEYQTTSLDVAKNKIASKQEVDFSKTAPIIDWQEVHGTTLVDYKVTKVDPSAVGTYEITSATTKIVLGKSFTFDSSTGYYTITNREYYDPSSIDFSDSVYYSCGTTITATGDNSVSHWNGTSCANMQVLVGYKGFTDGTLTLSGGDSVPTKTYTFSIYKYSAIELESDTSDKGIYSNLDDYGTTYYYRGNVTNNNVLFAGYYWKVIRINGDGSIRLLYTGPNPKADKVLMKIIFHEDIIDPTYVGYMYSNTLDNSYEYTIKNDNNSFIKSKLDDWYETNILNTGYSSYITDSGFCGDRTVAEDSEGDGYTKDVTTYYAPRYRMVNHVPTFKCPNITNDLYTLNGNEIGNGALTYPIGLVSIDEIAFAGIVSGVLNTMSYVGSTYGYWTMSPYGFSSNLIAKNYIINGTNGKIGSSNVTGSNSVRPVINLKADTEISGGIGTKNDPFIIK